MAFGETESAVDAEFVIEEVTDTEDEHSLILTQICNKLFLGTTKMTPPVN